MIGHWITFFLGIPELVRKHIPYLFLTLTHLSMAVAAAP
jgi:hypothetical protein